MKKQAFSMSNKTWSWWPAVALMVATAVPLTVRGADRLVLCEEFTSVT